ncbi:hypothetical protein P0R31_30525 [Bradyrhizobium yuanmingense]|uniref:hypothetical protein n=1 Tax=Bradyrhizobium yuanmingense TaxID=108015 RepID=UPI0023B9397A|nr:hypothetical protein [Bradyrhizobium yuanmingense]MDF0521585.1 hypothetical protein [Bradyrhizobium yuanmingense]
MSYERARATLARAHEALARTASIHEEIADRRAREALGLIPKPYSAPSVADASPTEQEVTLTSADFPFGLVAVAEGYPRLPINTSADLEAARLMSTEFAQELLVQVIAAARAECLEEIDALRAEVKALKRRRRRKASEDRIDPAQPDQR